MRFRWRNDDIDSHGAWVSRLAQKDDEPGRSAPTLATAWAGALELAGATRNFEMLSDFSIEVGIVEAQTRFDEFPGGPRNHDLLLVGEARGGRTVVSVEAKAGESLGQTVGGYLKAALKKAETQPTNAPARLRGLVSLLQDHRTLEDERLLALRYQLFSGVAGALAAAVDEHARQAVFFVHEFVTDAKSQAAVADTDRAIQDFFTAVFDQERPVAAPPGWCAGPLPYVGNERVPPGIDLFVAHAVTDLRPRTKHPGEGANL